MSKNTLHSEKAIAASNGMKILIGTPIHEIKDYSMERWLKNVVRLQHDHPADLLLVDNSPHSDYIKKVEEYCKKIGITNHKLVHIATTSDMSLDERLAKSREAIRREVLDNNYDAWYSLECDVLVPPDALTKLVDLITDSWVVSHGYPARGNPEGTNTEFGTSLISRQALEKYGFLNGYGCCDPLAPNVLYEGDVWFIKQITRNQEGKYINVNGIIKPIYHLSR